MLILHASAVDDRLYLWGERPPADATDPAAHWSPYDAGVDAILNAVAQIDGNRTAVAPSTLTIWLPTVDNTPMASSPLIAEPPDDDAEIILAPWTITALPLGPTLTFGLLTAYVEGSSLAPGVFPGKTIAYW